jgi:hypothetical protein
MTMNASLLSFRWIALLALLATAVPAHADPDGPPQPWFTFTVLRDFEPLAGNRVVVWPDRAGRAWLLTLAPPCAGLAEARLLALTAVGRRIYSGVDEAVVDGRRCRIQRLYRLDPERRAELVPAQRAARVVAVRPRPPGEQRPLRPRGGA